MDDSVRNQFSHSYRRDSRNRNSRKPNIQLVFIVESLNLREKIFCGFEQWVVGKHILLNHRPFRDLKRSFMCWNETTYRIRTTEQQERATFDDGRILTPIYHAKRTTKLKVGERSQNAGTARARRSKFPHPFEFERIKVTHCRARFSYRSIVEFAPLDSICEHLVRMKRYALRCSIGLKSTPKVQTLLSSRHRVCPWNLNDNHVQLAYADDFHAGDHRRDCPIRDHSLKPKGVSDLTMPLTCTGNTAIVFNSDKQRPSTTVREAHNSLCDFVVLHRFATVRLEFDGQSFASLSKVSNILSFHIHKYSIVLELLD
ncbi:hypothetical protein [Brevibacterium sp. S111]|uniref:hypothetical protein n=1 Tax=Brevibacterium sp. S111 TaxID=2483795 RepID=UPI001F0D56B3|nr:hypothetical protein [Brevibacterium sp. S111]